jgi:hypothetical protein
MRFQFRASGRRSRILSCLCALMVTSTAAAWGPEGHRITGRIAGEYLSDKAKDAVSELLSGRTLADVAVWADDVRQEDAYQWTAPLHYVNVPRDARRIDMRRDCENGMCVVGAIHHFAEVLQNKDGKRSRTEQREALKFIVHFIGDVHQPMHVSYRDDRGGNLLRVSFVNSPETNLHRVWDTDMIRLRLGDEQWSTLAREIQASITKDQLARWRQATTPVAWANESLTITRRIYSELPRSGELGRDYYEHYIGDVMTQLAAAGVRMADLLNVLFADGLPDAAGETVGERPEDDAGDGRETTPPSGVAQYLRIVEGDTCGRGEGRFVFLENLHESKVIRARVRRTWTTPVGERSVEENVVVRPGEGSRQRLGCSEQPVGRNEVRRLRWEVIDAEFR